MPLSDRENYLRTASLTGGEWIPANVVISEASWLQWREEMEQVVLRHPTLFPNYRKGQRPFDRERLHPQRRRGEQWTDNWGCTWQAEVDGITGIVKGHPLADWSALEHFRPPDPATQQALGPIDWEKTRQHLAAAREQNRLTSGSVEHGFLFLRLTYLRGYENLMMDMATDEPRLRTLVDLVTEFNWGIVRRYLECKVDVLYFGDDLGAQKSSAMGPKHFRKWIAPAYKRLMAPCRDAGTHVYLHTDGYIMDIVEDIVECGVTILNPQDLVNGVDNLAATVKGRICISLDIDRQKIVPYGTRQEIDALVEEGVRKLGSPQGGLMLVCGIYPPTPPENVDAVCCAIEKWRTYWWE